MELENLMEESIKIMQDDFYSKKFYFSYSSLNKLLWNPVAFHQLYVMGIKEERVDQHLVQGKIIHALLLEEDKFNDQFIVSPGKLPGDGVKAVVDRVFAHYLELSANGDLRTELEHFDGAILDVMKDMNYFQALKTDQQRLDKIVIPEAVNYWSFLKTKGNKTLIDQDTLDFCKSAVELVKADKNLCKLIGCNISDFDNIEVYNELFLQAEATTKPFGIKGIIDNLVINHDEKVIYINDVKTTSKELKDFPETIEFYSYWLQAIIYCSLVANQFKDKIELGGYEFKFHFVVIDKMFQTYAFPVSDNTLKTWLNRLNQAMDKAEWHYVNKRYDLPYEFATGSVSL
jgi:hypothetical protein